MGHGVTMRDCVICTFHQNRRKDTMPDERLEARIVELEDVIEELENLLDPGASE